MNLSNQISHISQLVQEDEIDSALKELKELFSKSKRLDEVILQTARYNDLRKQIDFGTIGSEAADISKNKIRKSILDLLREIENQYHSDEEVKFELDRLEEQGVNKVVQHINFQNNKKINATIVGRDHHFYQFLNVRSAIGLSCILIFGIIAFVFKNKIASAPIFNQPKVIFDNADERFKILICPFNQMGHQESNKVIGGILMERLGTLNNDYSLNINPYFLDINTSANFIADSADNLRVYHQADMIIYGIYDKEKRKEGNIVYKWITDPKWGFPDSIAQNPFVTNGKFDYVKPDSLKTYILQGQLQSKTDFLIYWIAAMSAYNQRNFSKSRFLLDRILNTLRRREPSVYSFISSCYFYENDFENYFSYNDSSLVYARTPIDSVFALTNLSSAHRYFGRWKSALESSKKALQTLSHLSDLEYCEMVSGMMSELSSIALNDAEGSKDFPVFFDEVLDNIIVKCGEGEVDVQQFLASIQELVNDETASGDSLIKRLGELLPKMESLFDKSDTETLMGYYIFSSMYYGLFLQDHSKSIEVQEKMLEIYKNAPFTSEQDRSFYLSNSYLDLFNSHSSNKDIPTAEKYFQLLEALLSDYPRHDYFFNNNFLYAKMVIGAGKCELNNVKDLSRELLTNISANSTEASAIDLLMAYRANIISHTDLEEYENAEVFVNKGMEIFTNLDPELESNILVEFQVLGLLFAIVDFYLQKEKFAEAEQIANILEQREFNYPTAYSNFRVDIYNLLSHLYNKTNRPQKARVYLDKMEAIIPNLQPQFNNSRAAACSNKALNHYLMGEFEQAIELEKKAFNLLHSYEDWPCYQLPYIAQCLNNLASYYFAIGNTSLARKNNEEALEIVEGLILKGDPIYKEIVDTRELLNAN